MRALRVLAGCDYVSETSCGGAERAALELYRRLPAHGIDVTVVTARPGPAATTVVSDVPVLAVPALDLAALTGAQVAIAWGLRRRLRDVADAWRPDVVHANGLHFRTTVAAAGLAARAGLPFVLTAHIGAVDHLSPLTRLGTSAYEHTVGRRLLRQAASVVAVAPAVALHVAALGAATDRITVIANGVDHGRFHPPAGPRSSRERMRVAFVGRLIANKGPHLLVEAAQELDRRGIPLEVVFVGDGPLAGSLAAACRRAGLDGIVHFCGAVADPAPVLRDADVVVRPSFTEGLPLGVLEAMACGACVVASDIPGNTDLVSHGHNGLLVPPGDATALADELASVATSTDLRHCLAEAGMRTAAEYSWDRGAAALAEVFTVAAAERRGAPCRVVV